MTVPKYLPTTALALTALSCSAALAPASAQETIRAISAFPQALAFSQSFQGFVDMVNERGEGVVQITYAGGPEMFPPNQQVDAESLADVLQKPFDGMRVLEVKADRSSLRALHAAIRAAL